MFPHCTIASKCSLLKSKFRVIGILLLFALGSSFGLCQNKPQPAPTPPSNPTPPSFPPAPVFRDSKAPDYGSPPERTPTFEDLQYRRYVMDRLRSMASDSDKLYKLEWELTAKIKKSGPGSLTRDDLRIMAEIEKLAHNIKWKMQLATDGSSAH